MRRRQFIASVSSLVATTAVASAAQPQQERETFVVEVPAGATLWGHAYFLADEPIEVTVVAGASNQTLRGSFVAKREAEYRWKNDGATDASVGIRAKRLGSDQALFFGAVDYTKGQHCYVAFGRRATPDRLASRRGGYPSHVVFVGFTVFGPT